MLSHRIITCTISCCYEISVVLIFLNTVYIQGSWLLTKCWMYTVFRRIYQSFLWSRLVSFKCVKLLLLAHLSRRLMGELIVYQSLRRPSVRPSVRRPSVRQHFQTSSPLKPLGQLNSNFIWRLLRMWERKFVQMVLVT